MLAIGQLYVPHLLLSHEKKKKKNEKKRSLKLSRDVLKPVFTMNCQLSVLHLETFRMTFLVKKS